MSSPSKLSRRERQIVDILFELNEASAQQVQEKLPEPPGYSAVRAMLARLETKGEISHKVDGSRYLYFSLAERESATENALKRLVRTFFGGNAVDAAIALLGMKEVELDETAHSKLEALLGKPNQPPSPPPPPKTRQPKPTAAARPDIQDLFGDL